MTRWLVDDSRPRATPDQIRDFLARYREDEIRHGAEVMATLRRDDPDESRISAHDLALTDDLRGTYRTRATRLENVEVPPSYPQELAGDVRAFSDQLDAARDQRARWWSVSLPSGIAYLFLELVEEGRIAGAIRSADQRVVAATSS